MSPLAWAIMPFKRFGDFSGRSPRAEYWWFVLAVLIGEMIAMIVDALIGTSGAAGAYGLVLMIFVLAVIIPHIAVGVRRLHDTDRSGWWLLMFLIPIIGPIVLLVFFCTRGDQGPNRFGDDPYAPETLEEVFA